MSATTWHTVTVAAIVGCWGAFTVVWILGAAYNVHRAPAVRRRTFRSHWLIGGVAVAVGLRAVPDSDWDHLSVHSPWIRWPGLALLLAATSFTLWARASLGVMWSANVVARTGHELRVQGPYAIVRHPIYTGILGMLIGSALLDGLGRWTLALVAGTLLVLVKARAEERLLTEEFPVEYAQYRRRVPALVPLLRRR
jgi:protein-S-isoprenylcysteine O-methyltransferase Ste14